MAELTRQSAARVVALAVALGGMPALASSCVDVAEAQRRPGGRRWVSVVEPLIDPDAAQIVVLAGQSNGAGVGGAGPVTTTPAANDYVLCQADDRLEPLEENYSSGCWSAAETPGSGAVAALRRANPGHVPSYVVVRCAVAGSSITTWDPDGTGNNYDDCITSINAAITLIQASPGTYNTISGRIQVIGIGWWQGESDEGMPEAEYLDRLVDVGGGDTYTGVQTAFIQDLNGASGIIETANGMPQVFDPPFIIETPSSFAVAGGPTTPPGYVLAQLAACDLNPTTHCVGGAFAFSGEVGGSQLHKDAEGHRLSGITVGAAMLPAASGSWSGPVRPVDAIADGLTITIQFTSPSGAIAFDDAEGTEDLLLGGPTATYGCDPHPNTVRGIELFDTSGTPPTLSGCSVIDASRVQCTMSRELVIPLQAPEVRVAWTALDPATAAFGCQGNTDNPFSNIRDTSSPPYYATHASVAVRAANADAGVVYDGGPPDSGVTPDAGVEPFAQTQSCAFNGTDAFLDFGVINALDGATEGLICYWKRQATLSVNRAFATRYDPSQLQFRVYARGVNDWFYFATGLGAAAQAQINDNPFATNTWEQTCWRFNGAGADNGARFRVWTLDEGGLEAQSTINYLGTIPAAFTTGSTSNLTWGAASDSSSFWGGVNSFADELAIWTNTSGDTVPSEAQMLGEVMTGYVEDLNNLSTAPQPAHWWRCEGNAFDQGTRATAGTENGSVTYSAAVFPPEGPGVADGGVPPDSGIQPDGGVAYTLHGLMASYGDPVSNPESAVVTTSAYQCSNGSGTCAFMYDEYGTATAREATVGGGVTTEVYPVQLVNRVAQGMDAPVGIVWDAFPGTRTDAFSTTNIVAWDNLVDAAIFAVHSGSCIWPSIFFVGGAGYQCATQGQPFATCWETPVNTFFSEVQTSAAALPHVCPDWTPSDMRLIYIAGSHQAITDVSGNFIQHAYSASFNTFEDAQRVLIGMVGHATMGTDDLHPNTDGVRHITDVWAKGAVRVMQGTTAGGLTITGATQVDEDTLNLDIFVPCVPLGTCTNDPPLELETVQLTAQTTEGGATTYGLHFVNNGTLQTGVAVSSMTFPLAATCTSGVCSVTVDFAGPIPDATEITGADWALGPTAGNDVAGFGASNIFAATDDDYLGARDGGIVGDWAHANRISFTTRDGGPVDSGTLPDAGSQANAQYVDLPTSVEYTIAEDDATLEAAEAMCMGGWVFVQSANTHCINCQWAADRSSLNYWFGTAGFGIGFGNGTDWTNAIDSTDGWTHVVGCFTAAASGPGTITLWRDGVIDTGTPNGTLPSVMTDTDGPLEMDEAGGVSDTWVDSWFQTTASGVAAQSHVLTTAQVERIFCATRNAAQHPDLGGGGCAAVTANLSDVCNLDGLWGYFPFEGSATAFCGAMALTPNGGPSFGSY